MNNKIFFGILAVVVVLFIGAFVFMSGGSDDPEEISDSGYYPYTDLDPSNLNGVTIDLLDNENYQDNYTLDEVEEKIQSGDDVYVYFWSPLCEHCHNSTPYLQEAVDETGIELYQLNILEYNSAFATYNIEGTPTTIHFKDGEEIDRIPGDPQSTEGYVQFIEAQEG